MSNPIPTQTRVIVGARDTGNCMRCGASDSHDPHHRRRRRENPDGLQHDVSNVVTLCRVCHAWCHANPKQAVEEGFVVHTYDSPLEQPIRTFMWGWAYLTSDGMYVLAGECSQCEELRPLEAGMCRACLEKEVCHASPFAAARALCGCGGGAAEAIRRLDARTEGNRDG